MPGGGGNSASQLAEQQRLERDLALKQGTALIDSSFAGFNSDFYDARKKAYTDYAMPQLGQQFRNTQQQTQNQLFDRGLQNSSQSKSIGRSLLGELSKNQQTVANQAQSQANQLQQNVENQRINLYNQLSASQSPSMVGTAALNAAQSFYAPSAFVPIGQLFSDWTTNYVGSLNNKNYNTATSDLSRLPQLSLAPIPSNKYV